MTLTEGYMNIILALIKRIVLQVSTSVITLYGMKGINILTTQLSTKKK
jgi:hypothetical protein